MNITNVSHTILGIFDAGEPPPPDPPGGFVPTGTMEPEGTTLFSIDTPPHYLDIGNIAIFFGKDCADAGSGSYLSTCELQDKDGAPLGGTRTLTFTDDALPCFTTSTPVPDNQEALDDLTCEFALGFQEWLSIQFDHVFTGTVNIEPNGFIDGIEVDYNAGMAKTRIRSMPLNGWPLELAHEDEDCQRVEAGNLVLGIVTKQIPANSHNGPGEVQLYRTSNGGGLGVVALERPPIKVSNWFSATIAVGKHVILGRIGCRYYVVSADC